MSTSRRERILESARNCFQQEGYNGASILQICQVAQVAPATLYRYFKDKRELFEAVGGEELAASFADPRRTRILEAALNCFSRQGYRNTTLSEIASHAGVARTTLYQLFPDKQAILAELLSDNPVVELIGRLEEYARQDVSRDPERDLELLVQQYLHFFENRRRLALMRLVLSESVHSVPLQRLLYQLLDHSRQLFSHYLSVLAPDLENPQFVAQMFIGGLLSFVLSRRMIPDSDLLVSDPKTVARLATKQLLNGIRQGQD